MSLGAGGETRNFPSCLQGSDYFPAVGNVAHLHTWATAAPKRGSERLKGGDCLVSFPIRHVKGRSLYRHIASKPLTSCAEKPTKHLLENFMKRPWNLHKCLKGNQETSEVSQQEIRLHVVNCSIKLHERERLGLNSTYRTLRDPPQEAHRSWKVGAASPWVWTPERCYSSKSSNSVSPRVGFRNESRT